MAQRKPLIDCLRGGRTYLLDVPRAEASYTAREPYEVVDGMAIIDVSGVLVAEAGYWDGWGVSGYKRIAAEILGAVENSAIDGILLRIDSPGGETDGAFELATAVSEAAKQKPLWALADVSAYSAAYLIASQAGRLLAPPESGGLGSIGVYALHMDYSGYLKDLGIRPTFITAGDGKTDGNPYEPLSRAARESFQAEVDRLYESFVAAVASGRGISESVIKNEFGARTYHGGETLVSMGLADGLGTLETAMKDFRAFLTDRNAKRSPSASFAAAQAAQERKGSTVAQNMKKPAANTAGEDTAAAETADTAESNGTGEEQGGGTGQESGSGEETTQAAYQRGYNAALQVVSLCAIAKQPGKALGYLRGGKSPTAVQAELLDTVAGDGTDEVSNHTAAGTSAKDEIGLRAGNKNKPDGNLLLAAVEKLGSTKGGL